MCRSLPSGWTFWLPSVAHLTNSSLQSWAQQDSVTQTPFCDSRLQEVSSLIATSPYQPCAREGMAPAKLVEPELPPFLAPQLSKRPIDRLHRDGFAHPVVSYEIAEFHHLDLERQNSNEALGDNTLVVLFDTAAFERYLVELRSDCLCRSRQFLRRYRLRTFWTGSSEQ
ncbi:hypothetical protein GGR56DRAFT_516668 [Xylariaceae sp. FL0804]|nr:hypothetical protein GGR56DRAFT_516668 [Xylariaceae sp. FL0804]